MKATISLHQSKKSTISASIQSWMNRGNGLYSAIMDDFITNRQALLITNVLVSIALIISFAASNLYVVAILGLWLAVSFNMAKKGGIR